jgi:hypothetical protein
MIGIKGGSPTGGGTAIDQNNKVIYFYPSLTDLGVSALSQVTTTVLAAWIKAQGITIASDEIPMFKVQQTLYEIIIDERPTVDGSSNMDLARKYYATALRPDSDSIAAVGAVIYRDRQGENKLTSNNLKFNYSEDCSYTINIYGIVIEDSCYY